MNYCNPQSKILWHLDRVCEFQKTGKTRPLLFEIDPSNKCNHNCPWCNFSELRSGSKDLMSFATMKTVLSDMNKLDVKAINWTGGGEPLMNPFTIDGIKYAHTLGLDQGIFTNGSLITEPKARVLCDTMTWVRISLDGTRTYAKSHGTSPKMFDRVIEGIKFLVANKNQATIGIGFVIHEGNYHDIEEVTVLSRDLGADYIQLKPMVAPPGKGQLTSSFLRTAVIPRVEKAMSIQTEKFVVMASDYKFLDLVDTAGNYGRNYKRCLSHNFQGAIGADGKVYVCDHHKGEKKYEIGDLRNNTLVEIMDSEKRKKVIAWLDSTDLSQCQICCRNHELNKMLWHITNKNNKLHPNHI